MAKSIRRILELGATCVAVSTLSGIASAAPSGAHPRLWLDAKTLSGLEAQGSVANSPVARGAARCRAAAEDPAEYAVGGWQGFEFVTTLSGCLVSYAATGDAGDLATAIKYWTVLLDDYATVGDGAGGDDVVTHDTGYAMRTFAPYSAIAYDWLHDAPGVTEELRAHARDRFDAWVTYYTESGYLRHMPGANYQAGYAFAATLIAIAEAGEAGSAGDAHWATVKDTIWGEDLGPAMAAGGVLEGGDWPEGWQYGPLSVLELGLAARAMSDNGVTVPGASAWADSLVLRFAHGLTPLTRQAYVAGDTDGEGMANREPDNGPLLAAIAGPASEQSKAWARALNEDLGLENENPLFDGIALARGGSSAALPTDLSRSHLATGAGNWYVRGAWTPETVWGVFQCSRRLVDDHQHNDAGNFVLTRGADDLVVDPSPYGTLSTLTSNAPAVDSESVPDGYSPSQANWGLSTRLAWARQSSSGIAAARCDYADQFRWEDYPSDVSVALRDFVLVPDGDSAELVLIDRVVTGDAARAVHLRVRTPGDFALSGDRASAEVGDSTLSVERVFSTAGTPSVREMPRASECPSSDHTCDVSRLDEGTEYRIDVAGPSAMAIHVVSTQASAPAEHPMLAGDGYRGVVLERGGKPVAVVTNDAPDGKQASTLSYTGPQGAVHVVVDAPVDANGLSDVTATADGSNCRVEVKAHSGSGEGFDGAPLIVALDAACKLADDGSQPEPTTEPDPDPGMNGGAGPGGGSDAGQGGSEDAPAPTTGGSSAATSAGKGGSSAGSSANGTGGTSGTGAVGTGGAVASGGVSSNGLGASAAGVAPVEVPTVPVLQSCSVRPSGSAGGSAGTLSSALLGLMLFIGRRRRAGSVPR